MSASLVPSNLRRSASGDVPSLADGALLLASWRFAGSSGDDAPFAQQELLRSATDGILSLTVSEPVSKRSTQPVPRGESHRAARGDDGESTHGIRGASGDDDDGGFTRAVDLLVTVSHRDRTSTMLRGSGTLQTRQRGAWLHLTLVRDERCLFTAAIRGSDLVHHRTPLLALAGVSGGRYERPEIAVGDSLSRFALDAAG